MDLGNGAVSLTAATTASVASNTLTVDGIISGNFGLTKAGSGTLLLTGSNTFGGPTAITAGVLPIGNPTALGSGTVSVTSGAALDLNGTAMTGGNALTLNGSGSGGSGTLTNSSTAPGTYAGLVKLGSTGVVIGGAGAINLSNTGTITGSGFRPDARWLGRHRREHHRYGFGIGDRERRRHLGAFRRQHLYRRHEDHGRGAGRGEHGRSGAAASKVTMTGGTLDLQTDTSVNAWNATVSGNSTILSDRFTASSSGITQTMGTLSLGTGTLTVASGPNVNSSAPRVTFGDTTLTGNAVVSPTAGAAVTLSGTVSGPYTLTMSGFGTLAGMEQHHEHRNGPHGRPGHHQRHGDCRR